MFIDRVVIGVRSGKGGDGAIAFLHEKYIAKGGPSGGNGGKGGSIIIKACSKVTTLINYRFSKMIKAQDGENGANKLQYGKASKDVIAEVPVGTVIYDEATGEKIADLVIDGQEVVVAKGGRGGRGNACFKSSRNKAPRIAENGVPAEEKRLILELKLLSDVGIVGFPNAGKSTYLSITTRANPLIADYEFTTIEPNLGVVYLNEEMSYILADIPGLIEGASQGKGLGLRFLRHVERCKVLIHMVAMDGKRDPVESYKAINKELSQYGCDLDKKPQIIVASKMDEEGSEELLKAFKKKIKKEVIAISALTNDNVKEVLYKAGQLLEEERNKPIEIIEEEMKVYEAVKQDENIFDIRKLKSDVFEIYGTTVEKTYKMINITTEEGLNKLLIYLRKIGVDKKLHEMGAKDGDTVILCDFEFEYVD